MPRRRSYAVHPRSSMVGLSTGLIDGEDLSRIAAELGLKPRSIAAPDDAAEAVQSALLMFLGDFGRERPLPAAEWQSWAKEVEASGRRMLELLQQPQGPLYEPNEERFSILGPGLADLSDPDSRLSHVHRQAFAGQTINDYDSIARAVWSVEYLSALARTTAAYWKREQPSGRRRLASEGSLALNLAAAYRTLTGKRATVPTKPMSGERYGPALQFMRSVVALVASRLESGEVARPGKPGQMPTKIELPERQTLLEIVARLKVLAGSPNPLADQLKRTSKRVSDAKRKRGRDPDGREWRGRPSSMPGSEGAE